MIALFIKKYTLQRKIIRAGKKDEEATPVDSKVELENKVNEKEGTPIESPATTSICIPTFNANKDEGRLPYSTFRPDSSSEK